VTRRPLIAVCGAAAPSPATAAAAEALGRALVDRGCRVITGGRGGVMAAASRGARASATWQDGDVLGLLPGADARDANPWVDVALPTGLGHARNTLLVAMADAVVAVGGGAGTLSEIALAWAHDKPVAALDTGEGWASELAGRRLDARREDAVVRFLDPDAAATWAVDAALGRGALDV
jgi:uncharacterized protein (TIGR00725 family)